MKLIIKILWQIVKKSAVLGVGLDIVHKIKQVKHDQEVLMLTVERLAPNAGKLKFHFSRLVDYKYNEINKNILRTIYGLSPTEPYRLVILENCDRGDRKQNSVIGPCAPGDDCKPEIVTI